MSHHQGKPCCLPDKARGKLDTRPKAGCRWVDTVSLEVSLCSLQGPVPATWPISAKARVEGVYWPHTPPQTHQAPPWEAVPQGQKEHQAGHLGGVPGLRSP